jgi:(S)-mandelate dehydrogenase
MQRRFRSRRHVERALTIAELRALAHRRLPGFVLEYLEGGAEDEVTLRRNRHAFERIGFVWRTLVDVTRRDISAELFGEKLPMPLAIGPTGLNGLFAHRGDLALAKAAAAAGVPFCQSTVSTMRLETIAAEAGGRRWMQLYMFKDRAITEAIVARAAAAGCQALVVTTDTVVFGNREWDRRHYVTPDKLHLSSKLGVLGRPRWARGVLAKGMPQFENLADFLPGGKADPVSTRGFLTEQMDASIAFEDIAWLRGIWPGKLIVKGILDADDARRAADVGADGVVVSNHGARQLDGTLAPIQVLPEVIAAVGGRIAVLIDGGFRRGTDVVKAMALGADLVLLGRATLYGLAADGEAGAARAIAILREEIDRTVGLLGVTSLAACRDRIRMLDRG